MWKIKRGIWVVQFLAFSYLPASAAEPISGRASVIDADTIEIHGKRIRFHGIDAVEGNQRCLLNGKKWRCGKDSAFALDEHIKGKVVRCEPNNNRDRWKRTIAVCYLGQEDLNRWLVREGWALAYRKYSKAYIGDEKAAQAAHAGIWKSQFVMPWDWRKGEKLKR